MARLTAAIDRVAQAILTAAMPHANAWDMVTEDDRNRCREQARAAIQAMRGPTKTMKYAGGILCEDMLFGVAETGTGVIFEDIGQVFDAMIDAALAESAA